MMLSYAIMVVPKEIMVGMDYNLIKSIEKFNVKYPSNGCTPEYLVKHLRNSISHARYMIDYTTGIIEFNDHNGKKETLKATIDSKDYYSFLDEFFKFYAKDFLEGKT